MTVSTEVNQAAYTGNGVTTVFPYAFRILNSSNLTVTRINLLEVETVLTLGTDYTVSGAGSYNGGAVTLPQPLPSGYSLVIERDLAAVQETDLRNQGTFFAEVHEDVFDYLTMLVQQVTSWLGLSLRRPTIKSKFYDAKLYRIANMADPVNDQDAVNTRSMRSYVEKMVAGVVGGFGWFIQAGSGAIYRTFQDKMRDVYNVRDFGVTGDGGTDVTDKIQAAMDSIDAGVNAGGQPKTLIIPDGTYRTSRALVKPAGVAISCSAKAVFQNINGDRSYGAWELKGGACRTLLGSIYGYGAGIIVYRNTHDITFQTISDCTDGVIIRADLLSNLDNEIRGVQIANGTNAIVFEQNADSLIQQGNHIRVNFVSETPNAVVFRNFGGFVHTKQSNWDSNNVELQAFDPLSLDNSSMVRNSTSFAVSNLKMTVKTWLGGWVPDAGTICLIRGGFSACTYEVSIAGRIGLNELVDSSGRTSFGSCVFRNTRQSNMGSSTSFYTGVSPGSVFNGGESAVLRKFRVRVTVPDLAAGAVYASSFNHILSQVNETGRARLVQTPSAARSRYRIEYADAGTEMQGMVRIWISNYTAVTQTGRDVDLIFEIE